MNDIEKELRGLVAANIARDLAGGQPSAAQRLMVRVHHVLAAVGPALANGVAGAPPELRTAVTKWLRVARELLIAEVSESDRVLGWYRLGLLSDFEALEAHRSRKSATAPATDASTPVPLGCRSNKAGV